MTIVVGRETFVLGPSATLGIETVFNSENLDDGGNYVVPLVGAFFFDISSSALLKKEANNMNLLKMI